MTRPLRSTAITAASSLLRVAPPLDHASILSASRFWPLVPFSLHRGRRFPQFNVGAQTQLALPLCRTPHGQYTGSRHACPGLPKTPGFDVFSRFSTLLRQFTCVRLLDSHLMPLSAPFPQRSRPGILTQAACGGLRPTPVGRSREAFSFLFFISHLLRRFLRHT